MLRQKVEGLGEAGQHAERQNVDLQDPQRVEIILVPFHHGAAFHGRVHDRHHFVQPVAGDDEAADMLGEMARESPSASRHSRARAVVMRSLMSRPAALASRSPRSA